MKNLILILFAVSIFTSCKKDDEKKETFPDNIKVTEINKTAGVNESIEMTITCSDLSFYIHSYTNKQVYQCGLEATGIGVCDAGVQTLIDAKGDLLELDKGDIVSGNNYWAGIPNDGLSLNHFAGKGEKYIGICLHSFSSGESEYRYGWLKLELSGTASSLKIDSYALNQTEGNSITAGQK